ncbi:AAA family ATPase [Microbacterium sp. NPDC076895]|uniref:AAA family ATPase n=1 Tax=Microbacterium sp. NPDC076895 TaxID=3154957 RepID=UPI0034376BB1
MRIRSVHFEAFKSLYDFTADLADLTVITGANGSGKSNLVDGLVFISNAYLHGLELAVSHGGGYENLAHRRTRRARRPIRLTVEVEVEAREVEEGLRYTTLRDRGRKGEKKRQQLPSVIVRHDFSFRAVSQKLTADFEVTQEWLSVATLDGVPLAAIRRQRGGGIVVERQSHAEDLSEFLDDLLYVYERDEILAEMKPAPSDLIFGRALFIDVFWQVARFLSSIRVFQLSPHTSRLPGVASPRAQLELHGDNLPGAADFLRRNDGDAWASVESAMRTIIPTLEEISIAYTEDRRLAVQFRERGVGRPWNSAEVSDGTIQAFALLVAIFDPRASILVIEELENALHPWILRQLLQLCQDSPRQILLTSHSPVLLTAVPPESVNLMWMEQGRSSIAQVASMDPEVAQQVIDGEITVFELLDSGAVTQALPRGLG